MSDTEDACKFVLRLQPKIHKKIKKLAKQQNTSMNRLIENTLAKDIFGTNPLEDILTRLDSMETTIQKRLKSK